MCLFKILKKLIYLFINSISLHPPPLQYLVPGLFGISILNSNTVLLCVHLVVVAILDYFQAAAMKYYSLAAEKSPRDAAEAEQVEEAKAYLKKHGK